MAEPLHVLNRLAQPLDHYPVFERDQVLTHGQLNGVTDYLDAQTRLSRVSLQGVGLAAGLHVRLSPEGVHIRPGFGVSTDGDLLRLDVDTVFDRIRPYDQTAPQYAPFFSGGEEGAGSRTMLSLHELVPVGESDVLAQPLASLETAGDALADHAVLMLMESVVHNPDLCVGTDCDNLGSDALQHQRFLLIHRRDAQALMDRLAQQMETVGERAQRLPVLVMKRAVLHEKLALAEEFQQVYRTAATDLLSRLIKEALPALTESFADLLQEVFATDPVGSWQARLGVLADERFPPKLTVGTTVLYDFAQDLADHWAELRQALLDDDSVLLPALDWFPKHLLLGALGAPRELRMGLYPSPLDAQARHAGALARFCLWKLGALIEAFEPPTDTVLRLTPSAGRQRPLQERAIPWYYRSDASTGLSAGWNFRRASQQQQALNTGYRARDWTTLDEVREPLGYDLQGQDLLRVEGHLGRPLTEVAAELRKLIADHGLPVQVHQVLLHTDRQLIRWRPPIRYTPLHSLHYLVRQDVAVRLQEGADFGGQHLKDATDAVGSGQVPATVDGGNTVLGLARKAADSVSALHARSQPLLAATQYSSYRQQTDAAGSLKTDFAGTLASITTARASLGHVTRNDFHSPFDALIHTNQPHWIDWLDTLIQAHEDRADDRLLFGQFLKQHTGAVHLGGVPLGGTLVLVYDQTGVVIADLALPYLAAEEEHPEPVEPPLRRPPYRPPLLAGGGIQVVRPVALHIEDKIFKETTNLHDQLSAKVASISGFVQGAISPGKFNPDTTATTPKLTNPSDYRTGDELTNIRIRAMQTQADRIKELQGLKTQVDLPEATRKAVDEELVKTQSDLANSVTQVTSGVISGAVDPSSAVGLALSQQLGSSAALISDTAAKAHLDTQLATLQSNAIGGQAVLIGSIRQAGGLFRP